MTDGSGHGGIHELGEAFELHFQIFKMTLRMTNNAIKEDGVLVGLATFIAAVVAYVFARHAQKTWGDGFEP